MALINEGIEYNFLIEKIYLDNLDNIIGFDYEIRISKEDRDDYELKKDNYELLPHRKVDNLGDVDQIISLIIEQEKLQSFEFSTIFTDVIELFSRRKSVSCRLSKTNIV